MSRKSTIDKDELKKLWEEGLSYSKIAKKLGVSVGYVKSLRYRSGLPIRWTSVKKVNDIEKVYEMRSAGKTYKEIATLFGVSRERIRQICKRLF